MTTITNGAKSASHALYRFFDVQDNLLYIGLTADVGARFATHKREKPWWTEIARITIQHYPDRRSVIEAERAAIKAERPQHNVVHNGARSNGTSGPVVIANAPRFGLEVGFIVALATDLPGTCRCFVGEVQAIDDLGVRITLIDWLIGMFVKHDLFVTWPHVLGASVWTEEHDILPGDLEREQNRFNEEEHTASSEADDEWNAMKAKRDAERPRKSSEATTGPTSRSGPARNLTELIDS